MLKTTRKGEHLNRTVVHQYSDFLAGLKKALHKSEKTCDFERFGK